MKYLAAILMVLAPGSFAGTVDWRITPSGYGPVRTGMTVQQAEKVLGVRLMPVGEGVNAGCYHVSPEGMDESLMFMVENHRISRVSLYQSSKVIKTDRNIGIGDSERKVKKAYGSNLEVSPHQHGGDTDKYLTYWNKNKSHGIRFETSNGIVDTIHGGTSSIRYVEGCS